MVKTGGTAKEFMTALTETFTRVLPHHFLAIWQEFALAEIPRVMPANHVLGVADYIMKYFFFHETAH